MAAVPAEVRPGPGPSPRVRAADLLPWAVGSAGLGALAVESPLLAAGVGVTAALAFLPWILLFALFVVGVTVQGFSVEVAGFTLRPEMLVATVFALRAFTMRERASLERVEWTLIAFMAVQCLASILNAADVGESFHSIALLGFGVLAYLSTYVVLSDRTRLLEAVRIFLFVVASAAAVGIGLLVAHYAVGSIFGVTKIETLAGFPAVTGLAYEHDLFGSTCAAAAIAFLVLWREGNPVVLPGAAALGFWITSAGTLLSLARGAWLGFAVGFVAVLLVSRRISRGVLQLLIAGALIAALGGAVLVSFSSPDVAGVGTSAAGAVSTQASRSLSLSSTATGSHRLDEWRMSLEEVRQAPILGLGTNSYGQRHFDQTLSGPKPAFVGNWFVRTLYDSGLVGLLLFLFFAGPIVWPGWSVRHGRGELAPVARALVLGCVVLAASYLATDSLFLVWPWVLLGLARAARVLSDAEERGSASVSVSA